MASLCHIKRNTAINGIAHELPSSKSISNRALILKALSGDQSIVSNLSAARDTKLMLALVGSTDTTIDVLDAGTTMRFLTAYYTLTGKHKILTGTDRMKQRPIALLVDALRKLGADISYLGQDGFPPIEVKGFSKQLTDTISIPGNVSSQYISALMMTAPLLPAGLIINIEGKTGSKPYMEMTASLMREFGLQVTFDGQTIHIPHMPYQPARLTVEED